jgi:hypothetical protein
VLNFTSRAILVVVMASPVSAGNGDAPSGKPFVEIQGQITEVNRVIISINDRLALLESRVDSIESALATAQDSIEFLRAQNNELHDWVAQLETGILNVQSLISNLQDRVTALGAQVEKNDGDIESLVVNLEDYKSLLLLLQSDSANSFAVMSSRIADNENMIALLGQQIAYLEQNLALKQNIINGQCPIGQHIYAINADGSIACSSSSVSSSFELVTVYKEGGAGQRAVTTTTIDCPEGTTVVSGGYRWSTFTLDRDAGYTMYQSEMIGNSWVVGFTQYLARVPSYFGFAYCKIN